MKRSYSLNLSKVIFLSLILMGFGLSSCSSDDNGAPNPISQPDPDPEPEPDPDPVSSGFTFALRTTGAEETDFIINEPSLETGTLSAQGTGIEQTGWRFYYPVGKTLFASGFSVDNQCAGYRANDQGEIEQVGQFIFENALEMFGADEDTGTLLAMEIPRAGFANRRLHFVDNETIQVSKIVGTRIFENVKDSIVAWPTALTVNGDKLFVPFHKLHASGSFQTVSADSAFVAVYDYPEVGTDPIKIIHDTRTSNIGANGTTTGLIKTETGDMYSFSTGSTMAGFDPKSTKPSGILKINAGETEFDTDYFLNITDATGGGNIFWFDYIGNNKAVARILLDDDGYWYGAYSRDFFNQKLVIIDLATQTVTDVADVPLHAKRYTSPVLIDEGKAYLSIETANEAAVYVLDIATGTATKGAAIEGKTIKGFFKL
ncbi:MAG: DUF4374 domain-containing protein [Bacteroidota bacterium]